MSLLLKGFSGNSYGLLNERRPKSLVLKSAFILQKYINYLNDRCFWKFFLWK